MDGIHCDIHHKTVDVITYPYPNLSQSHLVKEAPGHFFAPVLHKHFYKEVLYLMTQLEHCLKLFMPPPLGAGGIMFSGCPSVRPSEAWNNLFSPVHGSVGPSDQPWPFCGMSVCPSVQRGFRAFAGERMEGMVWNFACWCILGTFRSD